MSVHLCLSLARGLCLGGHGALQILGQPHVLHLDPLDPDAPGVRGLVQQRLHHVGDGVALGEDLGQVLGAQHVPQRGGGQQPGGVAAIIRR